MEEVNNCLLDLTVLDWIISTNFSNISWVGYLSKFEDVKIGSTTLMVLVYLMLRMETVTNLVKRETGREPSWTFLTMSMVDGLVPTRDKMS